MSRTSDCFCAKWMSRHSRGSIGHVTITRGSSGGKASTCSSRNSGTSNYRKRSGAGSLTRLVLHKEKGSSCGAQKGPFEHRHSRG